MARSKSRPLSALPLTPAFVVVLAACGGAQHEPPMVEPAHNPPMQPQIPEAIDAGAPTTTVAIDAGAPSDVHYNPPPMPAPPVTATPSAAPSAVPTAKGGGRKPGTGPKPLPPG